MLTIFKQGRFDLYLERLSSMTDEQFKDAAPMQSLADNHWLKSSILM